MHQEELPTIGLIKESVIIKPLARDEANSDDLRPFFTRALDLLCTAGFDGYFKHLNPMWTSCLGWALEELKARPFIDFVYPDDREATLAEFDRLIKDGVPICFENRCRHQNGSYRWLRWSGWLMPGSQRIYAVAQDITLQRRQEREILKIVDREKERLGLELHDSLCQSLAGIAALSSILSRQLAAQEDSTGATAALEINQLLNETIRQARDLAHGLSPIGLNIIGLQETLENLSLNARQWFNMTCTLTFDRSFPGLHHEVEGHLFRIAQEALNNAVKHGQADRVEISLRVKDRQGMLSIRDNGVGMSGNPGDSNGIGLHTMRYRARLIGGSLKVRQHKQGGMVVICTFFLTETCATCEDLNNAQNDTRRTSQPGKNSDSYCR